MSDEVTSVAFGALGSILGGMAAIIGVRNSRRAGVAGDEREARRDEAAQKRDTVADRDALIDRMASRLTAVEARLLDVEHDQALLMQYSREQDEHIDVLEDIVAGRREPPPPPRPTRPV